MTFCPMYQLLLILGDRADGREDFDNDEMVSERFAIQHGDFENQNATHILYG